MNTKQYLNQTVRGQVRSHNKIIFRESRIYIKNPVDAPAGADVKKGPRGGYYYDAKPSTSSPSEKEPEKKDLWKGEYGDIKNKIKEREGFMPIHADKIFNKNNDVKEGIISAEGTPSKGWKLEPETGFFDSNAARGGKGYRQNIVLMDADKFLRIQFKLSGVDDDTFGYWKAVGKQPYKQKEINEGLNKNEPTVPIPYLEFDSEGNINKRQEGRNRAIAALERGEPIPVLLVEKRGDDDF